MFILNQHLYKPFHPLITMRYFKEITIINSDALREHTLNEEIQWFSNCLGMFNKRDKEKSCFRIFINLLKEKDFLSSEKLAQRSNLSRATVIHHISKLMDSGLVVKEEKGYALKINNLEDLTNEIEKEVFSTFEKLRKISKKIDEELND